jgi:hypothetical protein
VLAFLSDPAVVVRILDHLRLPSSPPAAAPARWILDARCPPDRDRALFTRLLDV